MAATTHDSDFYTWTQQQASLLRQGRLHELDLVNLIEEVKDMGASERRELKSRLIVLLVHLLKWYYQPSKRQYGRSWEATIKGQRIGIKQCLKANPGLKPSLISTLEDAYDLARFDAVSETQLDLTTFPAACPWVIEQVLDDNFWPQP